MFVSLALLLYLTLAFSEAKKADKGETGGLGKIIFLPRINLLADFQEKENSIFDPLSPKCITKKTLKSSSSKFHYYKSTKALYKSLATESSLSASLTSSFTLSATVSVATKSKSSEKTEVSGISLIMQALTEKIYVDKECLLSSKRSSLKEEFKKHLKTLPLKIEKPWLHHSWKAYSDFLETYGSHVITSEEEGSRFQQMVFAESSESYSERDFQVRACISAAGPTSYGKLDVAACSNVSESEKSEATKMSTSETRFVRGGLRDTNSALTNGKASAELIKKLLNEAKKSPSPVQHTFMPIWIILKSHFISGDDDDVDNYVRATNLQYYYSGYLDYGCYYSTSGTLQIQKFDYTEQSTSRYPEFEWTLAKEGCHDDDDCHYIVGVWCSCLGDSCVHYSSEKRITGQIKETAYINRHTWDWKGCDWKIWGSVCECDNKDRNKRKVVWHLPITSKDAGKHKAHGNGTYLEPKDPVPRQGWRTPRPNTAEDVAKPSKPGSTKHHTANHPIQNQRKKEEEEM
ncbi:DELTA-alicitoxin-Pse2b-like [Stylophora pistillata]|nr:DELTA-alicitoxin-Pse2b-like [Stylophora pistillata]